MYGRWLMLMLAVLSAARVFGTEQFNCFNNCTCGRLHGSGSTVDCGGQMLSDVPANLPADTTELNLTNTGIRQVSWDRLARLNQLTHLYLESNPLLCDCKVFKFWKEHVAGDGKVKVNGTCSEPAAHQNNSLQNAAEALRAQCEVTSSSVDGAQESLTSKLSSSSVTSTENNFVTVVIQSTSNVDGKLLPSWTGQTFTTSSVVHTRVLMSSALVDKEGDTIEGKSHQSSTTSFQSSVTTTLANTLSTDASIVITEQKPEEPTSIVETAGVKTHVNTSSVTLAPHKVIKTTDLIEATSSSGQPLANSRVAAVVLPPGHMSTPARVPVIFTSSGLPVITSRTGGVDSTFTTVSSKATDSGTFGLPVIFTSSGLPVITSRTGWVDSTSTTVSSKAIDSGTVGLPVITSRTGWVDSSSTTISSKATDSGIVGLPMVFTSSDLPVITSRTSGVDSTSTTVSSKASDSGIVGLPVVFTSSGLPVITSRTSVESAFTTVSSKATDSGSVGLPVVASSSRGSPTSSSAYVSSTIVETPPLPSPTPDISSTVAVGPVIPVKTTSSPVAENRSSSFSEVVVTPSSPVVVSSVSPKTEQPTPGVPEEPVISRAPEDITVNYGETVSLVCGAEGNPKPAINFQLNGKPAENYEGVDLEMNGNQLVLTLAPNLTSQVECVAANKLGSYRVTSKLTVNSKSLNYQVLKLILIGEDWDESLSNKTSSSFRSLASKLESEVRSVLGKVPEFVDAKVMHFSHGSVEAEVLIKTMNSSSEAVNEAIDEEVKESHVGRVAVDRYKYSLDGAEACSAEFLNITWTDVTFGTVDIQLCPRGAKGFAKRNCSEAGLWGWPDYTGCHSENFLAVKNQFSMILDASSSSSELSQNQGVVQNMVISLMGDLVNVTTPHKEHAVMAGDITITTDIISQLVNFTRVHRDGKVSGDEEIQRVLDTASNLLDRYNVQEFIVAQRMVQTASKFIAQLELYGLQAAPVVQVTGENSMEAFISENVVMGARKIERPLNVTEDVVFPDYSKPNLQGIQESWNATSFIILRKDTIRKIKPGKYGNLMASFFLYKTLTRILSIESAFGPAPEGMAFELNSAVISSSLYPKPEDAFTTPIEIASKNLEQVELELDPQPICSYWDFELNAPHGGWTDGGCYVSHYNMWQTTCHCNHMTNFAVLRKVPLPVTAAGRVPLQTYLLCIYIGCWVFLFWAALTFIVLLLCCRNLKPDYTWVMHLMVCTTLIVAFALILVGLDDDSYNKNALCNLLSILVHYFYLCAFSWIMAEGVYMHKWSSINGPKGVLWVWYTAIGWLLPGFGCALVWAINNKSLEGFESPFSCWMSLRTDLIWTFFGIAFILTLASILVFRLVWRDVLGPLRVPLKSQYWKTRFRVHVRYSIILQVMFLLTWLLGILLTTYHTYAILCVLFIIFCFITGFLIFLFYCLMDRQVRDSSRSCFCFCRRKKQGKYWVNDEYNKPTEEEGLVPDEKPDQNEKAVEMNNFTKREEIEEEPLLSLEAQPVAEEAPDGQLDHVYAKVDKSKKTRNVSEDSNEPIGVAEPRTRLYSGLTRAEVIRMAKKSDASRDEAKQYETPEGSRENLLAEEDTPPIVYTPINQEELDEELRQFRSFFAQRQSKKFASTSTPAVTKTTTTVTTTTVVKSKKNAVENGPNEVFQNGIEGSSPEEPSSPKEPRSPPPQEPEQIQTNVRQETHVEETVTTSVLVRASDLHALELLAVSEEGGETEDTGESPSQEDQPAPGRIEGQDFKLFLDDDDLMETPPELPARKYDGDAIDEDDFTSTIHEKDENVPDLDILESVGDQESPDLTTVTEISTLTMTTVERGTDDSKELPPPSETEI